MTDAQKILRLENEIRSLSIKVARQTISSLSAGGQGSSAYELALDQGYEGSEEEWIESLVGADGANGQGVPVGGTTNQVLEKIDNTDFNTQWVDPSGAGGLPVGGTANQLLEKIDGTDFNAQWVDFTVDGDLKYARYRNESGQNVDVTVDTQLVLDVTEVEDAPFTVAANVVTINETATYLININLNLFDGTTDVNRYTGIVSIYVNGVAIPNNFTGGYIRGDASSQAYYTQIVGTIPLTLTATDTVEFYIRRLHNTASVAVTYTGSTFAFTQLKSKGTKGNTGTPGADGDMTWEGAWSAGTYLLNQVTESSGSSYVCNAPSTTQQPPDTDWDLLAEKGDTGSLNVYAHLLSSTVQNHGGVNGTVKIHDWDDFPVYVAPEFTHDRIFTPSRITVSQTGRYSLYFVIGGANTGSNRITLMTHYLVNGGAPVIRGRQRNYSRGVLYNDLSVGMTTEVDLTAGDYIEVATTVDDADAGYTVNSIPLECELIIRKLV